VTSSGARRLIACAVGGVLVSVGCGGKRVNTPESPQVQVVLLEDPANPSAATVTSKAGTVVLTSPYDSTTVVTGRAPSAPVKMNEDQVTREFGPLLASLPPPAQHFNLYFKTDTSELTPESHAILPDILAAVASRKVPDVAVIGHTDTTGSAATNYRLGMARAQTVRGILVKAGLEGSLVEVESHGERSLLRKTPDNTPDPRNRRVEITIR
jgi:outer membrane protein OmpA-like peptidoglycan-associated protein